MNDDATPYRRIHRQALDWSAEAQRLGWLPVRAGAALAALETQHAADLFEPATQRPLLVALFGGTGVGKSSLLNRLAGRAIADVGVVRPTSHRVTLYLHESYRGTLHEQALPTAATQVVYHRDNARRLLAWLDMPDIDSTERANRGIVEAWLPLVDWLIYVVTPERYQDDQGWRFVQVRGHRHAWLFVINHWDEAAGPEWADFRTRLEQRGFADPVVLKTSCATDVSDDDFARLEQILKKALDAHGVQGIEHALMQRRWSALDVELEACRARLLTDERWQALAQQWNDAVTNAVKVLHEKATTNADLLHQYWRAQEEHKTGYLPPVDPNARGDADHGAANSPGAVVDALFRGAVREQINRLANGMMAQQVPAGPLDRRLESLPATIESAFSTAIAAGVARALRKPGTWWRRALRRVLAWLQVLLPLGAAGWAAWHTAHQFYLGTQNGAPFLGIDFAIHAALLIGLSWLIPWYLHRQLRPSYVEAVYRGLQHGISRAGNETDESLRDLWTSIAAERGTLLARLSDLRQRYAPMLEERAGTFSEFSAPRVDGKTATDGLIVPSDVTAAG